MSTMTGLADLLFGRTRGAVLALLYGRADQSFYTRQIAREVDASVGAVQRELETLARRPDQTSEPAIRKTHPCASASLNSSSWGECLKSCGPQRLAVGRPLPNN